MYAPRRLLAADTAFNYSQHVKAKTQPDHHRMQADVPEASHQQQVITHQLCRLPEPIHDLESLQDNITRVALSTLQHNRNAFKATGSGLQRHQAGQPADEDPAGP